MTSNVTLLFAHWGRFNLVCILLALCSHILKILTTANYTWISTQIGLSIKVHWPSLGQDKYKSDTGGTRTSSCLPSVVTLLLLSRGQREHCEGLHPSWARRATKTDGRVSPTELRHTCTCTYAVTDNVSIMKTQILERCVDRQLADSFNNLFLNLTTWNYHVA